MAPVILQRLLSYLTPLIFFAIAAYAYILVFLEIVTFQQRLQDITSWQKLDDRIFAKLWLLLTPILQKAEIETVIPSLVAQAKGTVVEIGPGSGNQLSRYDKAKVQKIYGIEPNANLHDALRKRIKEQGLSDIYTIVPCGIEDSLTLEKFGLVAESADSVMSIQVLCSVPTPDDLVQGLYRLLRPGGQMIVYEHVKSADYVSNAVQQFYNVIWPKVFSNCHLDRETGQVLRKAGNWTSVDIGKPENEEAWHVIPHVAGTLLK